MWNCDLFQELIAEKNISTISEHENHYIKEAHEHKAQ